MTTRPETLEEAEQRFVDEWNAGHSPSLKDYVEQYPDFAEQIADFILDYLEFEAVSSRLEMRSDTPEADAAAARAIASLDTSMLPEADRPKDATQNFHAFDAPVRTLTAVRKEKGWTPAAMANATGLPLQFMIWLEEGSVTDIPRKLLCRIADTVQLTIDQASAMLSIPAARKSFASNYKASGTPEPTMRVVRTCEQALDACVANGSMTDEQRRQWLVSDGGEEL